MTINSMTGFARASGSLDGVGWLWEMKSVNGRGLEVRCRLPSGFDHLEDKMRKAAKSRFERGNINLHLQLENRGSDVAYQVNQDFLDELLTLAHHYVEDGQARRPRMDGMLALRGVIEPKEDPAADVDADRFAAALLASAEELMESMAAARAEEGAQLRPVLGAQLDEIETLVSRAGEITKSWPERTREKIKAQMALILEAAELEEGRLEQELALLTTKADISEEIDRLTGHIAATRELLDGAGGGVGRRLDFICQEFNREANTLCSKAHDKELTQIGLDLKVLVDKMREQVQNIE
ncbi:YicC/YloC family endoribonuclease [Sneathiella sp.]|uniref:YicC/YloC family endoribonuclease n=1 Tax=Sneathiella sp. TaxID=1964365 RepID=UPI002620E224|nr:YicC/YloC family endoribonuclease [Sneathiella sp.]MDF2368098.1 YicC family protein [Sneathiella sp.]